MAVVIIIRLVCLYLFPNNAVHLLPMKILFLHGALASMHQFDELRKQLPSPYQTYALNFSGHGGKTIPLGGLNFDAFTKDILDFLDSEKIDRINLFGFSMGGYAALHFASRYPQRVEKIMTLNVKFKWDAASTLKETAMLDPDKMLEKVPFFANNLMVQHGMNMWKQLLNSTSDMMHNLSNTKPLQPEELAKIYHEVLLGLGEKDNTSSLTETMEIRDQLAHASLLVIPNAPHPFEKMSVPRLVFEITDFFAPAS
jgi:pimeloyl-ACP methyl ester carboxylesterase